MIDLTAGEDADDVFNMASHILRLADASGLAFSVAFLAPDFVARPDEAALAQQLVFFPLFADGHWSLLLLLSATDTLFHYDAFERSGHAERVDRLVAHLIKGGHIALDSYVRPVPLPAHLDPSGQRLLMTLQLLTSCLLRVEADEGVDWDALHRWLPNQYTHELIDAFGANLSEWVVGLRALVLK